MRRIILLMVLILLGACATTPPQPKQFDVFFQVNSAKLTPEGQQVVDTIVAAIRDRKPSSVVVEGEADGAAPRDAQLADQRATSVAAALKAAGVDPSKIAQHAALALPAQQDATTRIATHKVAVQLMP
ncbi:MAG TPA: OmpA family protein [Stellaceae bacterium]|nr:OmpA family protein [Stellaceae bacterium]